MFRRLFLSLVCLLAAGTMATAQDWRQRYPELVFSVTPSENAGGVTDRFEPFLAYLSRELGVRVTLRIANDYAAVIEALRTGQVHFAHFGPAAYARALVVTNGGVEPLVTLANSAGAVGYFSVLYVRAGDPAQSITDLRGRNICLVDPNSASGNNVPRFTMNKLGIDPEQFFGRVVYAGSHENAVMGLIQGTCDGAFNWWNTERESNLLRMAAKGMVKAEDVRIILKSTLIPGSPVAVMSNLPVELRERIRQAFLDAAEKDPAAFQRISDGQATAYVRANAEDYQVMQELLHFVDQMRRRRS
jgi:phosphonate transport system substrate-binding protein